MKEFALKGRKIGRYRGRIVTGVEYCIVHPSVWRPCRARRRDGEIPALNARLRLNPVAPAGHKPLQIARVLIPTFALGVRLFIFKQR